MNFKVVIKEDLEDGGYNVSCPALPGCHSQGDTIEEALENIKDAIQGCMEVIGALFLFFHRYIFFTYTIASSPSA
jgi:predicted RNase H-like HicB family nuclease